MFKRKCNNRTILHFLVSIIVAALILVGCQSESSDVNTGEKINEECVVQLEGDNIKEINYLFYNEAVDLKHITLSFHQNYTEKKFGKLELLQDNNIVSDNVVLRDTVINNNGQFTISLPEYVERFNQVRFFDEMGSVIFTLRVGQYILEDINIPNNIPEENRWALDGYETLEKANEYEIKIKFTQEKSTDAYEYKLMVPKELAKQKILEESIEVEEKGNPLSFTYNSRIDIPYFKKNDYVNIAYELLIIQQDESKEKSSTMSIIYIPLVESI
ncbi:hypothetical protein [Paenibacillus gallinarum]|uniref:Intracellular proteinase inhibitor BsuPI domain-containing protein n=1 Tax=Paenibacillus gallinarum TaxID=2762232 RepID=A0ABR8T641_9BACL|nr:hypothetical protein [Paenibacillus gallinarum]MBD7971244.1 hypothetical protein [Paenibacillus gallinarum]